MKRQIARLVVLLAAVFVLLGPVVEASHCTLNADGCYGSNCDGDKPHYVKVYICCDANWCWPDVQLHGCCD